MRSRVLLALCVACLWLGAPAQAENPCAAGGGFETLPLGGDESGIGGTGLADPDGIGGTGRSEPESGIGGTGLGGDESGIGGTGVYGTVTGFGSICVNGLRVAYASDVAVEINGSAASAADLAVGQVVFLVAEGQQSHLETQHIAVFSAVVGSVSSLDRATQRLEIEGREVHVAPGTAFANGLAFDEIAVGDTLNVSGLPDAEGVVVASRIARVGDAVPLTAPPAPGDLLTRSGVERVSIEAYLAGTPERLDLGGLRVDLPERTDLRPGVRVRAVGRFARPGVLRIERIERPTRPRVRPRPAELPRGRSAVDREPRPPRIERPERPQRPEGVDRPEQPAVLDRLNRLDRPRPRRGLN